jgi:hypothetical protein
LAAIDDFANFQALPIGETKAAGAISPLAGEMSGRTEGGAKGHKLQEPSLLLLQAIALLRRDAPVASGSPVCYGRTIAGGMDEWMVPAVGVWENKAFAGHLQVPVFGFISRQQTRGAWS